MTALRDIKIVSGGQTGADRAALDFAIARGVAHGGWCPKGRRAEDGRIDGRYGLQPTPRAAAVQRTEWNVRDSDGTVVFSITGTLQGGSRSTVEFARRHRKPLLHLSQRNGPSSPECALLNFIRENRIRVLNVAGPRESEEPEIAGFVSSILTRTWRLTDPPSYRRTDPKAQASGPRGGGDPRYPARRLARLEVRAGRTAFRRCGSSPRALK